jgi:putative endonuclease
LSFNRDRPRTLNLVTPHLLRGPQTHTTMPYYTYILTNKPNGTFYTGVTNNLQRRVFEHKEEMIAGFTKKFGLKILVYYESYEDVRDAIHREKIIKKWKRSFKIDAIKRVNPKWNDLYFEL